MPRKRSNERAPDSEGFCERLRICASRVKNLTALAEAAGIAQRTLWSYSQGTEPSRPVLIAVARAAKVRLLWLITGTGPMEIGEAETELEDESTVYPSLLMKTPPSEGGLALRELLPVYDRSSSSRELHFGGIALWVRSDVVAAQFPHANLRCLATCAINDATHLPALRRGEWIVVDTSRRELFEGVGVIRMDGDIKVREMRLVAPHADGRPATYEIVSGKLNTQKPPLRINNSHLGGSIDLLGEVLHVGLLKADGEDTRR